jgi:type VI secretion system secreted protein Hcp
LSWGGVINSGSVLIQTGAGAGRSYPCNVTVVKASTDRATPLIFDAAASGRHIREASFVLRKVGGSQIEFAKYVFSDVLILSGGDTFSFTFARVRVEYVPQKADGTAGPAIPFGWDFAANKEY